MTGTQLAVAAGIYAAVTALILAFLHEATRDDDTDET